MTTATLFLKNRKGLTTSYITDGRLPRAGEPSVWEVIEIQYVAIVETRPATKVLLSLQSLIDLPRLHLVEEGLDGVLHEAADGHRTDSARDRRDH